MSVNFTPHTWTAEEATSTLMNTEIKDPWAGIQAAWSTYTPTWTAATVNPAIGDGTITGHYLRVGKTILFEVVITMGSTTTYGTGQWAVSLPVAPTARYRRFSVDYYDVSNGGSLEGSGRVASGVCKLHAPPTTAGGYDRGASALVPFTFASTDVVTINGMYEAS